MLLAAENLSDDELLSFARFICEEQAKTASSDGRGERELRIKWCDEQLGSGTSDKEGVATGPLDLDECLGRWAGKMKSYGIIKEEVKERSFVIHSRHMVEPEEVREVNWWLSVSSEYFKLVDLIERAGGNVESSK